MSAKIIWTNERRKLRDLTPWPRNPRGKTTVSCANCGKEIERYPSQIKQKNFCSRACMVEHNKRSDFYTPENHGNWKGGPAVVFCQACGKQFTVKQYALKHGRGKFCSNECQRAGHFVKKVCEVCGKQFELKRSHDVKGNGRYCSMLCRSIGYKQRGILRGEKSPRYIDGKSQTAEYVRRASHMRRVKKMQNGGIYTLLEWIALCAKFGNRCLCCGRDDVQLTVDHIVPVSMGGSNDISNIQPLCKSCNSRKHQKIVDYR